MDSKSVEQRTGSTGNGRYKPPFNFAMGGVPLGNEFEFVTDKEAYATIEAAWDAGVRYYDVAPWYGLGLAERRFGNFLHAKNRSEYISPLRSESCSKLRKRRRVGGTSLLLLRPTMWSMTIRRPACGGPSRIACKGSVSTASILRSSTTSRQTTSIF